MKPIREQVGNTPMEIVSILPSHHLLSGVRNKEITFKPFMIITLS